MSEKKYNQVISFRAPKDLLAELETRAEKQEEASASDIARRDLDRYYTILSDARRELKAIFTETEQDLICEALNGTLYDSPLLIGGIRIEIEDAIRLEKLDKKWKVKGPALMEKINNLHPFEEAALVDAVEQFWRQDKAKLF